MGKRVKVSIGQPAKWYGSLVFEDKLNIEDDAYLLAFDDGELRSFTAADVP